MRLACDKCFVCVVCVVCVVWCWYGLYDLDVMYMLQWTRVLDELYASSALNVVCVVCYQCCMPRMCCIRCRHCNCRMSYVCCVSFVVGVVYDV